MPSTIQGTMARTMLRIRMAVAGAVLAATLALTALHVNAATTLLPNGQQCFANSSGALTTGSVYMYYPATTTFKQSWQDANQSSLHSQPILLDSNGCATIYGVGSYRQVVYTGVNSSTTLFFDKTTTDTSAFNSVFWAGLSSGSPNTVTITYTGFTATDGTAINFIALSTNTGAVTLNPSGFGAISVVKDTTAGPIALTGGEINAGNLISVVYYTTDNSFHLVNTVIASASGATAPLCGTSGLVITNNTSTPNTIITVTAAQSLMQTTAGLVINRSSVSININLSTGTVTSTANGMDGEAVGTSQWLYLWLIDNGSAAAGLAGTSSTAPTMPSGYTYKCRIGTVYIDSSGNLMRFRQSGQIYAWTTVAGVTNNTLLRYTNTGAFGTSCNATTNPITYTLLSNLSSLIAPTATDVQFAYGNGYNNAANSIVCITPSASDYGGATSVNQPPLWGGSSTSVGAASGWLKLLTAQTAYGSSSAAGGFIAVLAYRDAVNAN